MYHLLHPDQASDDTGNKIGKNVTLKMNILYKETKSLGNLGKEAKFPKEVKSLNQKTKVGKKTTSPKIEKMVTQNCEKSKRSKLTKARTINKRRFKACEKYRRLKAKNKKGKR